MYRHWCVALFLLVVGAILATYHIPFFFVPTLIGLVLLSYYDSKVVINIPGHVLVLTGTILLIYNIYLLGLILTYIGMLFHICFAILHPKRRYVKQRWL